jgi:prevent-host-death family protein
VPGLAPKWSIEGELKIEFKTLKMMELRSSPGEILDRVARDGEVFVVERNGQPKACLVPVSFLLPDVSPARISQELDALAEKNVSYRLTINERKELEISSSERAGNEDVLVRIVLPHGYPHSAPRIYADNVPSEAPGRWPDGSLSIFGAITAWNSKSHDAVHALRLAREWLRQLAGWKKTGKWPNEAGRS